ncbi:single-stranded DNA-binding protein [Tepidibacter formicigenes]|jgi:single-strand DNA-binding protein|uniref:Single-stranded DNA-binding protein n=1 Tax=Tepidibacter formicigenes DSM 15518 TaxID=1123349 RepID=A0A1M6P9Q9_9FIRM|nr:single-stranded DNA-binding protein [Tepidibacter formicigenes]SHK04686.1 single-strand DNA-binding protein [Tepidibacter formicigenes DSM 15518]
MNSVVLVGRLTKDPELRYIPGTGRPVATFSIAVNRAFVNKEGKREADFFNIVVWGKPGENCANYLSKGRLVSVRGSIQNRSYETQTGERRYITEIVADRVEFLESKGRSESASPAGNDFEKSFEPVGLDSEGFQALDDDDIPF